MKLQKNNQDIQTTDEKVQIEEQNVSLKELKKTAKMLELKIDNQNARITKLLNSIEKMAEMNAQLVITIEEMLYTQHHMDDNIIENVTKKPNKEQTKIEKAKNWVKIN